MKLPETSSGGRGDPPWPQAPWWRDLGWGRAQGMPELPGAPWLPPFAYIYTPSWKPSGASTFPHPFSVPPPPPFHDRGCQETPSWHPLGGRIHLRELLHR